MRILFIMVSVAVLSCGQNADSKKKETVKTDTVTKTADTAKTTVVPDPPASYTTPDDGAVNVSLKAKYGDKWHVQNDKEATWMKDAFEYFIVPKRKEFPNYPYIAKGDFDGDSKADTAAVVMDSLKTAYQIAVLMGSGKTLFWKEDIGEDAAISMVPKSTIDGMDGEKTKKVKMKADGINVEYYEKASFVLYWDKGSFKRIQTSD